MWIESHQSLLTHRKTARLSRALGVSKITAIGHLHAFWWWCMDNAKEGDLSRIDAEDIADGAYWEGDASAFVSGLIHAGFVDNDTDSMRIHDWHEYAGKLIERRKSDAERKKQSRQSPDIPQTSAGHPQDIHRTAHVPNRTEPNQPNQPNRTDSDPFVPVASSGRFEDDSIFIERTLTERPDLRSWLESEFANAKNVRKPLAFQAILLKKRLSDESTGVIAPPIPPPPLPAWDDAGAVRQWLSDASFCGRPSRSMVLRGESLLFRQGNGINVIGGMSSHPVAGWQCEKDKRFYIPSPEGYDSRPVPFDPGTDALPPYVLSMVKPVDPAHIVRCLK